MPPNFIVLTAIGYHDRTLVLDDVAGFLAGTAGESYRHGMAVATPGRRRVLYDFKNVHVIYRGGSVLPNAGAFFFQ